MIDLSQKELFEDLLTVKLNNEFIDLHNDFNCEEFIYDKANCILKFLFRGNGKILLTFIDVEITRLNVSFGSNPDSGTLNNFYRGRFEINGKLFEYREDGRGYYYLEFETDNKLELHARSVLLSKE